MPHLVIPAKAGIQEHVHPAAQVSSKARIQNPSFPRRRESSFAFDFVLLRAVLSVAWRALFRLRRVTSFLQRKEVTKKRRPGIGAAPSQKKKRDGSVPCASRLWRAFATGHPWPVAKGFGIHASPGANTRAGSCRHRLRCSAPITGGTIKSQSNGNSHSHRTQQHQKRSVSTLRSGVPSPLAGEG